MEHINALNAILKKLQDDSTLAALKIEINPAVYTANMQNDSNSYADADLCLDLKKPASFVIAGGNLENYGDLCQSFGETLLHYLLSIKDADRATVMQMVRSKIEACRETLPPIETDTNTWNLVEEKANKLGSHFKLWNQYPPFIDEWCEILKANRQAARDNVFTMLESELNSIEAGAGPLEFSEVEVSNDDIKKMAWLIEIGVADFIMRICSKARSPIAQTAKVIEGFTGLTQGNIAKYLRAYYGYDIKRPDNSPLHSPINKSYVADLRIKLKLPKE